MCRRAIRSAVYGSNELYGGFHGGGECGSPSKGGKIMSDLKIFTENIEPEALNQIYTLVKQPAFADCKVRIMPDGL